MVHKNSFLLTLKKGKYPSNFLSEGHNDPKIFRWSINTVQKRLTERSWQLNTWDFRSRFGPPNMPLQICLTCRERDRCLHWFAYLIQAFLLKTISHSINTFLSAVKFQSWVQHFFFSFSFLSVYSSSQNFPFFLSSSQFPFPPSRNHCGKVGAWITGLCNQILWVIFRKNWSGTSFQLMHKETAFLHLHEIASVICNPSSVNGFSR